VERTDSRFSKKKNQVALGFKEPNRVDFFRRVVSGWKIGVKLAGRPPHLILARTAKRWLNFGKKGVAHTGAEFISNDHTKPRRDGKRVKENARGVVAVKQGVLKKRERQSVRCVLSLRHPFLPSLAGLRAYAISPEEQAVQMPVFCGFGTGRC